MNFKYRFMIFLLVGCVLTFLSQIQAEETRRPTPIIFDTDIGNDVDDVLALGLIHSLQSCGECELLAVTITKDNPLAAQLVDAINTFYGRPDIPIGVVHGGVTPEDGTFLRPVLEATENGKPCFPHDLTDASKVPEAVLLLRKTLAAQPDNSVVIVQVGFSTNLSRLLDSPSDSFSLLNGRDLVKQKVRFLSMMAGNFTANGRHFREFNVVKDIESTKHLCSSWPTPIIFSGFEVGMAIVYPRENLSQDYSYVRHHPLAESYRHFKGHHPHGQPTWDLTSVLYAVRPAAGYFTLSSSGQVFVEDDGTTRFEPQPDGQHRYLIVVPEQVPLVLDEFRKLCSRPPDTITVDVHHE